MKTLQSFLFEQRGDIISDDAVYYTISMHKYKRPQVKPYWDKDYNIKNLSGSDKRKALIKAIKDNTAKILQDQRELIPRKYWDLTSLIGETEKQLMSQDYYTMMKYMRENNKKQHDVLTIFECSNDKPYCDMSVRKRLYLDKYRAFTDCCCAAFGVVPLEYSMFYPFRFDEWDHAAEKEDIAEKYSWVSKCRFLSYFKAMGYKKCVVAMQYLPAQNFLYEIWRDNINNAKDWMYIVNTPEQFKKYCDKLLPKFHNNKGMVITRLQTNPMFYERYQRLLKKCLDKDQQRDFDELLEILDIESQTEYKEKLKEFNKKHNVEPYDVHGGSDDTLKLRPFKSDIDRDKVDNYKEYFKKFLENVPKEYDSALEDEKYHKHFIIFSILDVLMKRWDKKILEDIDVEYYNLKKAMEEILSNNKDYVKLDWFIYCYKPLVDELGLEKVQRYTDKLGMTQFNDSRIK